MANFKKGDAVAILTNWDRKGTVNITRATVHSWGKKLARFQYADGTMFKQAMYNSYTRNEQVANVQVRILADASDAELEAAALEMGQAVVEYETAHFNAILSNPKITEYGEGYANAIRKSLAALHEPRFRYNAK